MPAIKKSYFSFEKPVRDEAARLGLRHVLATVSGGADSVALLAALKNITQHPTPNTQHPSPTTHHLKTTALHCNFHLRGEESMRDQRHVENLCRKLGVDLIVKDFDVAAYMTLHPGISTEMACRELRYEWFREQRIALEADRIATGHNADDNIETLLLNLFRGSGTTGLRGMLPDTGEIWRPLLPFHRTQILDYLKEKDLDYITDSTNLSSDYRRNFLRNEVLPLLRTRWPGLDTALDRSIRLIREDNAVVTAALDKILKASHPSPTTHQPPAITVEDILTFPAPELLVRRFIDPLRPRTTTAAEILAAIRAAKPHARTWALPLGTVTLRAAKLTLI